MADNILSSLLSQASFTIVDSTGQVQASNLKVIRTSVKLTSVTQKHQNEDGYTYIDSKTIKQTQLDVDVYCATTDDVRQVNDLLQNRTKLYTITSKGLTFGSMVLETESLKQSAEVLSATPVRLVFKEILVQNVTPVLFKQAADSSVIPHGLASVTNIASSTISGLVTSISRATSNVVRNLRGLL